MKEWQDQKRMLRDWYNAALGAGNKDDVRLLEKALADHNKVKPTREEFQMAQAAYRRRVTILATAERSRDEEREYEQFLAIDRLMRQRYGVNVGQPA
jgi:hypothetical protein